MLPASHNSTLHGRTDALDVTRMLCSMAGELHMLPKPAPFIVQRAILDNEVVKIRAKENSVVLQLSSRKVRTVMEEKPALSDIYQRNVTLWEQAVSVERLSKHWLFGSCPPEVREDLSSRWTPRVYPEGSLVVGEMDETREYCVIILSGAVLLKSRHFTTKEYELDRVSDGCVLNELTLLVGSDATFEDLGSRLCVMQHSSQTSDPLGQGYEC